MNNRDDSDLAGKPVGLLLNFHTAILQNGMNEDQKLDLCASVV